MLDLLNYSIFIATIAVRVKTLLMGEAVRTDLRRLVEEAGCVEVGGRAADPRGPGGPTG